MLIQMFMSTLLKYSDRDFYTATESTALRQTEGYFRAGSLLKDWKDIFCFLITSKRSSAPSDHGAKENTYTLTLIIPSLRCRGNFALLSLYTAHKLWSGTQ